MVSVVDMIHRHRAENNSGSSETLYYELLSRYYRRVQEAQREGQPLAAYAAGVPSEIFYALDIVPMQMENITTGTVATLKIQDEVLALAQALGWTTSICSSHRVQAVMLAQGWLPRPQAVVWAHQVCDPSSKSGEIMQTLYNIPGFCLDRPYKGGEKGIKYLAQELGDLVHFLEGLTNRRLDGKRFLQVLDNAWQMAKLQQQIYRLRGAAPCPMSNRQGGQIVNISMLYSGTEEGIKYLTIVRDELQAQVEQGIGYAHTEKYRLVGLFPPPTYNLKLLDWMEREHGAMVVAEPLNGHWSDWEIDTAQPLESLARKCYAVPNSRQMNGPAYQAAIPDTVGDALGYRADGAIFWANASCPQCGGIMRILVDALQEQAGIPSLILYGDMLDPSGSSHTEVKGQIEAFLETLERKKKKAEVVG